MNAVQDTANSESHTVSLRALIRATGGRPFFIKRTKLTTEAAERYLSQSKSPRAPDVAMSLQGSAKARPLPA